MLKHSDGLELDRTNEELLKHNKGICVPLHMSAPDESGIVWFSWPGSCDTSKFGVREYFLRKLLDGPRGPEVGDMQVHTVLDAGLFREEGNA